MTGEGHKAIRPVKRCLDVTLPAEVKSQGTAVLAPSAPKPGARYEFRDQDTVQLEFRAQRNF